MNEEKKKPKYGTASIPTGVLEEIDNLVKELRFWPSRGASLGFLQPILLAPDLFDAGFPYEGASGEKVLEKERGERQND